MKVTSPVKPQKPRQYRCRGLLYKENHALDAWFKKAYGGEQKGN